MATEQETLRVEGYHDHGSWAKRVYKFMDVVKTRSGGGCFSKYNKR